MTKARDSQAVLGLAIPKAFAVGPDYSIAEIRWKLFVAVQLKLNRLEGQQNNPFLLPPSGLDSRGLGSKSDKKPATPLASLKGALNGGFLTFDESLPLRQADQSPTRRCSQAQEWESAGLQRRSLHFHPRGGRSEI